MKGSTEPSCNIFTYSHILVSPVVRFHTMENLGDQAPSGYRYNKVTISHCLSREYDPSSIKVRYGNIYKRSLREIQLGKPQEGFKPFYEVEGKSITVYTSHFCDIVCTSTQKICTSKVLALPFGLIRTFNIDSDEQTNVKVKIFLCSILYSSTSLQKVRQFELIYLCLHRRRFLTDFIVVQNRKVGHPIIWTDRGIGNEIFFMDSLVNL